MKRTILITPLWWSQMAAPMQTFLFSYGADCIEGDCPAGTLAFFSPWGNVVMFYGAASRYSGLYILGKAIEGAGHKRS